MKRVLITGANSYIGMSFEKWMKEEHPGEFEIDIVDMKDNAWREKDFTEYDTVFHVAGIAHVDIGHVTEKQKQLYYKVNCDLAIETAEKAKESKVKQFIFMSSIIIYGDSAPMGEQKIIDKETMPKPSNFYGDSKWQADRGVRELRSDDFHVAVLRPPMIYGKGSKGNYPTLSRISKKLFIFPKIKNERSMIHIDNLCEFIFFLICNGEDGVFFPQNIEYVITYEMVERIAKCIGHRVWITRLFNPFIFLVEKVPCKASRMINKAFGNLVYDKNLSNYYEGKYQVRNMEQSIEVTEKLK